jgi:GT2 family glycosyltransferase
MQGLSEGKATVCVVNYRTLALTRLCLTAIRKSTVYPHEIVVVDNDSRDASLEYLRGVSWIKLIERRPGHLDRTGGRAHGAALDLALSQCQTEFFISLHSDTIVARKHWLEGLIRHFESAPSVACVGTGKLEAKPSWQLLLKRITDVRALLRALEKTPEERARYRYFNRTICSAYRTAILRQEGLSFGPDEAKNYTVGQKLYLELLDRGYECVPIPARQAHRWMAHLAHATVNANAVEFGRSMKKVARHRRRHIRALRSVRADELFSDVTSP